MPSFSSKQLIPFLDATRLEPHDSPENIERLCLRAQTPWGPCASVCVLPEHAAIARKALSLPSGPQLACVANFPESTHDIERILSDLQKAMEAGASEIDVVFPYLSFLKGQEKEAFILLRTVRQFAPDLILKIILEVGAFLDDSMLRSACDMAIDIGADFLKTSTGKHDSGPTLHHAQLMMESMSQASRPIGFKVSGGIKTPEQAYDYASMFFRFFGEQQWTPRTFRVGASSLLETCLQEAALSSPHYSESLST